LFFLFVITLSLYFLFCRSYAIDDPAASEIDDAIAIERDSVQPETRVWIHIHVADPTAVIAPNSVLDMDARRRATSVYMPHRRIMMLPKDISESLSLISGI
jgi:exoribonuclease R